MRSDGPKAESIRGGHLIPGEQYEPGDRLLGGVPHPGVPNRPHRTSCIRIPYI